MTADIESQVDQQAVKFIRDGYAGASLHFRVEARTQATVRECLWAIGGYNRYNPGRLCDALADILPDCSGAEIGRESSPVLYLGVPRWTHHTFAAHEAGEPEGEHIAEEDRETIAARIMAAGKAAGADEVDVALVPADAPGTIANSIIHVRLWWD